MCEERKDPFLTFCIYYIYAVLEFVLEVLLVIQAALCILVVLVVPSSWHVVVVVVVFSIFCSCFIRMPTER